MSKVKVTVIKKSSIREMFGNNLPVGINQDMLTEQCHVFKVGQEFIIDASPNAQPDQSWEKCPAGFCPWAYADIQRDIVHLIFGGSYPWVKEKGVAISCCTDGLRPVVFKIERIQD